MRSKLCRWAWKHGFRRLAYTLNPRLAGSFIPAPTPKQY